MSEWHELAGNEGNLNPAEWIGAIQKQFAALAKASAEEAIAAYQTACLTGQGASAVLKLRLLIIKKAAVARMQAICIGEADEEQRDLLIATFNAATDGLFERPEGFLFEERVINSQGKLEKFFERVPQ